MEGSKDRKSRPRVSAARTKFDLWLERCRESEAPVCLHVISADGSTRFDYTGQIITVDRYFIEILPEKRSSSLWLNKGLIMAAEFQHET